jgi:hypothetical protein
MLQQRRRVVWQYAHPRQRPEALEGPSTWDNALGLCRFSSDNTLTYILSRSGEEEPAPAPVTAEGHFSVTPYGRMAIRPRPACKNLRLHTQHSSGVNMA